MLRKPGFVASAVGLLALFCFAATVRAQVESRTPKRPLITQTINEENRVTLKGNTRREANPLNDRGQVAEDFAMEHMLLQLKTPPEQEQELRQFVADLQNPKSPAFHQWIGAEEFGQRFGLAQEDLDTITRWLQSHGFAVNVVYSNATVIDFSGTAGQVREAFHTEIHNLEVNGVKHVANMDDPEIPAALAPAVAGIVSLNNFMPHGMHTMRTNFTFTTGTGTKFAVTPSDLATIYNLNPLFGAGVSGQGQTVAVIEDTNVYSTSDWTTFRSIFGLSGYTSGSFTQVHPAPASGQNNCTNPALNGDDGEAILDAEYASAAAPSATIQLNSCEGSFATFGGLIALQNMVNGKTAPPAVISISYGECEAEIGATANAAYSAVYEQAVTEGVSVFVAAGDAGAAGCNEDQYDATYGIGISGFASTPYNVAVGGTDFGDSYAGTNANYWSLTNSATYGSALSYVPEIPWDDSCANSLVVAFVGYSSTYGVNSFCNAAGYNTTTFAGSGGPSACATGTPASGGLSGGSCVGYPKPSWQAIVGNPNDGVRDIPDVSLFAATGLWGHSYVFCDSDTGNSGTLCVGSPSGWSAAGGTSFASPIMAGIQALVNQQTGSRQGNPAPTYYSLAAGEYGPSGNNTCNSTLGNGTASNCVFYDVTQGDNVVNCSGTLNCYDPAGTYGVLSTSSNSYSPAFKAATGWDFATGIGTVNAANLVNNWPTGSLSPNFTLSASPTSATVTQGAAGTSTVTIAPQNGFTGSVALSASGLPSGVTAAFSPASATTSSVLTLTASSSAATGTVTVTITGTSGTLTNTATLALTVNAAAVQNFTLAAAPSSVTVTQGAAGTSTVTIAPQNGFTGSVALSASGLPSGVTAAFSPASATTSSVLTLTASSSAATGTVTVTITGTSGTLTNTATLALTVNAAAVQNFTLSAAPSSVTVTQGAAGTSTVTIAPQNGFTGSVALSASGLPSGVTASFSPASASTSSVLTLTASGSAATGTVTVTITGTSGTLTNTATLALTVNAAAVQNFTLSAAPSSVTVTQGAAGTSTVTIAPQNGFTGSVALSASGLPSGVTAAFSPTSATTSSVLTLTASSAAATGSSTVTITGISGALTQTATVSLTVNAAPTPTFTLSASPTTLTLAQGGSGAGTTVTLTPQNGFSGNVTLSASGLPSGVSATFNPAVTTSSSSLTLTASNTAATGTTTVTITGVSGSLTKTASVTLTVNPAPSFALSASPASVTITQGGAGGASAITITPQNGFSGSVGLSASGLPNGVTASFSPASATTTSTLTLTASSSATTGTSSIMITGVSGGVTQTVTIGLTVNASNAPNFSLTASPTAIAISQGNIGASTTITLVPVNGFAGSVSVSLSPLPNGVSSAWSGGGTSAVLTLTASNTATLGTSTVTITGTSGSLVSSVSVTLTVNTAVATDFTLSASPTSVSVTQGSSGGSTVTVSPLNGFSGNVNLSATGLPAGVTASFTPTTTSRTSTLKLTASNSASIGTFTVTILGTSGSLSHTTTVSLTVRR